MRSVPAPHAQNRRRGHRPRIRAAGALGACLLLGLTLAACNRGSGGGGGAEDFVVGHTYPDLQNPYYVSVREEVERQMEQRGHTYITTDSGQDPSKQVADIENLVSRGVDLLFVDAVDPTAVVPGVQAANQADIPVVALVREPAGGEWDSFLWIDSVAHGKLACEYIVEQLGGSGAVVELRGIMSTQPGQERSKGCNQALEAAPGIELVAQQDADFNRVDALNAMTDIITAQPRIDAVFGANDEEALGAVEAFEAAGVDPAGKVIVGIDGTQEALEAICAGKLSATVATIGKEEGEIIGRLAEQVANGEELQPRIEFEEVFVTPDNLAEVIERSGFDIPDCPAAA